MGAYITNPTIYKAPHYLVPSYYAPINTAARNNGTVFATMLEIVSPVVADAVTFITGATVSNHARVGIYAAGSTDTPAGGALLAEGEVDLTGGTFFCFSAAFASPVALPAGQYWLVLQVETSTTTIVANGTFSEPPGFGYTWAHVYGAFDAVGPAVTGSTTTLSLTLRTLQ